MVQYLYLYLTCDINSDLQLKVHTKACESKCRATCGMVLFVEILKCPLDTPDTA